MLTILQCISTTLVISKWGRYLLFLSLVSLSLVLEVISLFQALKVWDNILYLKRKRNSFIYIYIYIYIFYFYHCLTLSRLWGRGKFVSLWAVSKVESLACASHLPRFILLVSFCDTLRVVLTLEMIAICDGFCSPEGAIYTSCGNYGSFLTFRVLPFL